MHVQGLGDEQDQDQRLHRHRLTPAVAAPYPMNQEESLACCRSERDRHHSKQVYGILVAFSLSAMDHLGSDLPPPNG